MGQGDSSSLYVVGSTPTLPRARARTGGETPQVSPVSFLGKVLRFECESEKDPDLDERVRARSGDFAKEAFYGGQDTELHAVSPDGHSQDSSGGTRFLQAFQDLVGKRVHR